MFLFFQSDRSCGTFPQTARADLARNWLRSLLRKSERRVSQMAQFIFNEHPVDPRSPEVPHGPRIDVVEPPCSLFISVKSSDKNLVRARRI